MVCIILFIIEINGEEWALSTLDRCTSNRIYICCICSRFENRRAREASHVCEHLIFHIHVFLIGCRNICHSYHATYSLTHILFLPSTPFSVDYQFNRFIVATKMCWKVINSSTFLQLNARIVLLQSKTEPHKWFTLPTHWKCHNETREKKKKCRTLAPNKCMGIFHSNGIR